MSCLYTLLCSRLLLRKRLCTTPLAFSIACFACGAGKKSVDMFLMTCMLETAKHTLCSLFVQRPESLCTRHGLFACAHTVLHSPTHGQRMLARI